MKRKMMRIILTGVCAVCLIACGKSEKDAVSDYYQEQFGMSEEDADELADALYGNGGVQTEAEPEAEAAPETEAESSFEAESVAADFEYHYDEMLGGVVITGYKGEAEAIRIPAKIDGYLVEKICLDNNERVTHVELADGITCISEGAFYYCSNLTEITIPDSVKWICDFAFCDCSSLTEITIPDSVTSIGGGAFRGCSSLTEITIPDSVIGIGDEAFCRCSSLTEITMSDGLTSINNGTFAYCDSLTEITIPDSVTSINSYAFRDCSSLTEITIPDSVTSIGDLAFCRCSSLRNLTIPDNTKLGISPFLGCAELTVTYQGEEYNYANDPNHWWRDY